MRYGWLVLATLAACSPAGEPARPDPSLLGRWDVTVHGDETYPMWFEIVETDGGHGGRLQQRFGHALELERVQVDGGSVVLELDGTVYEGELEGERLSGTGRGEDGATFHWVAVRAPELPSPEDVTWGEPVELIGDDLEGWRPRHPSQPNQWSVTDGVLRNEAAGTDLVTESRFENFRLHAEVNVPEGSNSGIYLRGRYEVQVQDDFGKEPGSRFMGGIYGQVAPVENAARPAGEWQSFDITLLGRYVTVVLNGTTVIDNEEIPGITGGALDSNEAEPGPIFLQGDHGPVSYRNLVVTEAR